jgi:biopolymer transport protein ExbB
MEWNRFALACVVCMALSSAANVMSEEPAGPPPAAAAQPQDGVAADEAAVKSSRPQLIMEGTLWDIFQRGGNCMWFILLCSIVGVAFSIERFIDLRRNRHLPRDFHKDVVHIVDARGVDAGLKLCLDKQSSISRVLYAALLRHGTSRQEMEAAINDEGTRLMYDLRRNTRVIGIMANLATMFGLLGTCVGLIDCFDKVAVVGTGKTEQLATGVAIALLTTAYGLMVAIPLSYLHFHLRGKADDIVRTVDELAIEAVLTLDRKARQSIRLIEDLEEHVATKDMPAVKEPPPDLAKELEVLPRTGSGIKTSITTPVNLPVANPPPKAND